MIVSSYTHALVVIFFFFKLPCELHILVKKIKNYRWTKNSYFKIKVRLCKRILYLHSSVSGKKKYLFFLSSFDTLESTLIIYQLHLSSKPHVLLLFFSHHGQYAPILRSIAHDSDSLGSCPLFLLSR